MKKAIMMFAAMVLIASAAVADMSGKDVYFNYAGKLWSYDMTPNPTPGPKQAIGDFYFMKNTNGEWVKDFSPTIKDIAFDTNGQLYGVSGLNTGSFWGINPLTAEVRLLGTSFGGNDIGSQVNALANYGPGQFYSAVDGGTTNQDRGHFYTLNWDGTVLTGTDVGVYHANVAEYALFNPPGSGTQKVPVIYSTGDIWVMTDNTVYATVTELESGNARFLVTVNPDTAEVTYKATLWTETSGDIDPVPSSVDALFGYNDQLYLLSTNGNYYSWNGTSLSPLIANVGGQNILGATAIPAPGAILLGMMGLGLVGWVKRRMA